MKSFILALFSILILNAFASETKFKQENGVYILDDKNYQDFLGENQAVFLELYARNNLKSF